MASGPRKVYETRAKDSGAVPGRRQQPVELAVALFQTGVTMQKGDGGLVERDMQLLAAQQVRGQLPPARVRARRWRLCRPLAGVTPAASDGVCRPGPTPCRCGNRAGARAIRASSSSAVWRARSSGLLITRRSSTPCARRALPRAAAWPSPQLVRGRSSSLTPFSPAGAASACRIKYSSIANLSKVFHAGRTGRSEAAAGNRPIPGHGRFSILNSWFWFGQQDDWAGRSFADDASVGQYHYWVCLRVPSFRVAVRFHRRMILK